MKKQLAKALEISVETLNYWVISYALSSMTLVFRAEWPFVVFFASEVWLLGRYYEEITAVLNSRKWAVLVCALVFAAFVLFVSQVGLVQGSVAPFSKL